MTEPIEKSRMLPVAIDNLIQQAGEWFALDVANGDARPDTINAYMSHLNHWLIWCQVNRFDPGSPSTDAVKAYRQELIQSGAAQATISLKLTTVRRFYDGAVARGFLDRNPALGVKAPRNRTADDEIIKCLTIEEARLLIGAIPKDGRLKSLRDRAMSALMMLEGLRRIEICRANIDDLEEAETGARMFVRGKGKDGYIYPREDTLECLSEYLKARKRSFDDDGGKPMFVSLSKAGKELGRITRDGLSKWIDTMLKKSGIAKNGRACHSLRHTCGALLYQATKDVKVVQETLRHSGIAMAAKYSHVESRGKKRYTKGIPVEV